MCSEVKEQRTEIDVPVVLGLGPHLGCNVDRGVTVLGNHNERDWILAVRSFS